MNSSFAMVIFGATGDLAQNKLVPFALFKQKKLPDVFLLLVFQDEITQTMNSEITLGNFHKSLNGRIFQNIFIIKTGISRRKKAILSLPKS